MCDPRILQGLMQANPAMFGGGKDSVPVQPLPQPAPRQPQPGQAPALPFK